ncbi:MAG: hypothetical protein CMF99_05560 [Candidatus Marinimicrobia bacterium]|nr:hypothetical protein [Candidatus Neomarinimicrobiota bacterium]|tara:strand:- start:567 stop:785 length:219 start_codon:yes stop_codon:yes gene_type:complete
MTIFLIHSDLIYFGYYNSTLPIILQTKNSDFLSKYFAGLLTCSVIAVAMIYIINPLEGLGQSPRPIVTPPDA